MTKLELLLKVYDSRVRPTSFVNISSFSFAEETTTKVRSLNRKESETLLVLIQNLCLPNPFNHEGCRSFRFHNHSTYCALTVHRCFLWIPTVSLLRTSSLNTGLRAISYAYSVYSNVCSTTIVDLFILSFSGHLHDTGVLHSCSIAPHSELFDALTNDNSCTSCCSSSCSCYTGCYSSISSSTSTSAKGSNRRQVIFN